MGWLHGGTLHGAARYSSLPPPMPASSPLPVTLPLPLTPNQGGQQLVEEIGQ